MQTRFSVAEVMWAFFMCRCEYDWNGEVDTGSWWGRGMCAVNGGSFDDGNATCSCLGVWIVDTCVEGT